MGKQQNLTKNGIVLTY